MQNAEQAAAQHWGWQSHLGPEDGPSHSMSAMQCAFSWRPTGAPREQSRVVLCDVEGLQDWDGRIGDQSAQLMNTLRAIQGVCPICQEGFRIDPAKAPCTLEPPAPMVQGGTMAKYPLLTVLIPVKCGSPVVLLDDLGQIIGKGTCDWEVVVRRGVATNFTEIPGLFGKAIEAAKREWSLTARAIAMRGNDARWKQALDGLWAHTVPAMQRMQAGVYERSGDLSVVGVWNTVDHFIMQCRNWQEQLKR